MILLALVTATFAGAAPVRADDADKAYLGKWLGEAGSPLDRVAFGLELDADAKGAITGRVTIPVSNLWSVALPGTFERDGDHFIYRQWKLSVARHGDMLDGLVFYNLPLSLKRTSALPEDGPVPDYPQGPPPKWAVKLGAPIYARAAVSGSTIYLGTSGGMFYALNVADGSFRWAFTPGRPVFGEALVEKDGVYFACDNGYLFKLDPATGHEIWRADIGDGRAQRGLPHPVVENSGSFDWDIHSARPVLAGNTVLVGSGDGRVYAIDAASGKTQWSVDTGDQIRGEIVVDGALGFAGNMSGKVVAIDLKAARIVWTKDTRSSITGAMALVDGSLIVTNRSGLQAALDPATGTVKWKMLIWNSSSESTAVPAGAGKSTFYIGSSDMRRVSLMDAKDGRVVWRTDVLGLAWPAPLLVDGTIYQSASGADPYTIRHLGGLVTIDAKDGHVIWRWASPKGEGWLSGFAAAPALAKDKVIVGSVDGTLYAFDAVKH
jgi:outer membrane protein assembly factor BamB